jgi:hypothetical protein
MWQECGTECGRGYVVVVMLWCGTTRSPWRFSVKLPWRKKMDFVPVASPLNKSGCLEMCI